MHEDRTPKSSGGAELPHDHPYLANLAALWAAEPALAARVEAGDERFDCDASFQRDPAGDVAGAPLEGAGAVYLFGLGLGHLAECVFDRTGGAAGEAVIFIFEPCVELLRAAFWSRDLSRLIDSGRVGFVWRDDKAALFAKLQPQVALVTAGAQLLAHPPSVRLNPAFHAAMQGHVTAFASYATISVQTLVQNGRRTAETVARNFRGTSRRRASGG